MCTGSFGSNRRLSFVRIAWRDVPAYPLTPPAACPLCFQPTGTVGCFVQDSQEDEQVEIGSGLKVEANRQDDPPEDGCGEVGCSPDSVRDDSLETRWSCYQGQGADECLLHFDLGEEEFLTRLDIAFYDGDEISTAFVLHAYNSDSDKRKGRGRGREPRSWIFSSRRTSALQAFPIWSNSSYRYLNVTSFMSDEWGDDWVGLTEVKIYVTGDGHAGYAPDTPSPTPSPTQTPTRARGARGGGGGRDGRGRPRPSPSPAPTPALARTYPPFETPAPLVPFAWPLHRETPAGAIAHGYDDSPPDSVHTVIGVSIVTGLLAMMGVIGIVLGIMAVARRRKKVSTHATSGESDFGSPMGLPSSVRAASTFGVEAWEVRPPPSVVGLAAHRFGGEETPVHGENPFGLCGSPRRYRSTGAAPHDSQATTRLGTMNEIEWVYRTEFLNEQRYQDVLVVDNPLHPQNRRKRTWERP